ncbi:MULTISPECIES: TonB family protein [unclassified Methylophilus]|uniref:TonB family protein n=1 Tax=unclassified Methylophilus TaxID=2630143 RepID=UPI00039F19F2|nr:MULTISPECIES: TonB family protein [unclassified Methylophilus]
MSQYLKCILFLACFSLSSHSLAEEETGVWLIDKNGCKAYLVGAEPSDTLLWDGDCIDGYISGKGTAMLRSHGKLSLTMKASFYKGQAEGHAIVEYADGAKYEGTLVHGVEDGSGRRTWPNGVVYSGLFSKGEIPANRFKQADYVEKPAASFPEVMSYYGHKGKIILRANIDQTGRVTELKVDQSHHPAFEKAAIKAILKAKFSPRKLDNQAIPAWVQVPFTFTFKGDFKKQATSTYRSELEDRSDPEVTEPVQYKVVAPVVYPFELYQQSVDGSATITATINPAGEPSNVKVIKATHEAFGRATKAMIESSLFTPAYKDNAPIWSSFTFEQTFTKLGRDVVISENTLQLLDELNSKTPDIHKMQELDKKLNPLYAPRPVFPAEYRAKDASQRVLVEFYVDKQGEVQLPHIIKADNEDLAWIALSTVSRWLFEPPTIKGKPVDVVAKIPVVFEIDAVE